MLRQTAIELMSLELEPVECVQVHRKRMMCAKRVAVETEYFNCCGALNMRTNANYMWNKTSSCIKEEWLDYVLEIVEDGHRTVKQNSETFSYSHTQLYCANYFIGMFRQL